MHRKNLHELAKFGAGLIAGDFLGLVWMANAGALPITFLGRTFTTELVLPALIFDAALFLILVHYGWNLGKIPSLRERTYLLVSGTVFGVVGLAHLMRIFAQTDLVIAGWTVPLWLSWIGTVVTAYLAYMSLHLAARIKK